MRVDRYLREHGYCGLTAEAGKRTRKGKPAVRFCMLLAAHEGDEHADLNGETWLSELTDEERRVPIRLIGGNPRFVDPTERREA